MAPRVSVLVNNHNYGRYLGPALESVLRQDVPLDGVEIIAVDDGSSDDSRELLSRFAPRVRAVLLPENRGQAAAFNAGFQAANGEILCLLDSDDWWAPEKLRRVLERFEREPDLGMVQHWCQEIGPDGRPFATRLPPLPPRYGADDFLRGDCVFTGTTGLSFRADVLRPLLPVPEDLRICADGYLHYAVLDAPVGNIPEPLAFRRVHGGNRYAGRFGDPIRLKTHRRALTALDRELSRLLSGGPRALAPEAARRQRAQELLEDMFLARYAGQGGEAWRLWRQLIGHHRGTAKAAKAASLFLALLSPRLYLSLQGVYARLRDG